MTSVLWSNNDVAHYINRASRRPCKQMSHQQITLQAHILQAIVLTSIGRNKQTLPQANFLQANVYKLMSTSKVDKQMWNKQISCHLKERGKKDRQAKTSPSSAKKCKKWNESGLKCWLLWGGSWAITESTQRVDASQWRGHTEACMFARVSVTVPRESSRVKRKIVLRSVSKQPFTCSPFLQAFFLSAWVQAKKFTLVFW